MHFEHLQVVKQQGDSIADIACWVGMQAEIERFCPPK
jgi:hypothetical protein